jgi:gliding motility-associated-like protein
MVKFRTPLFLFFFFCLSISYSQNQNNHWRFGIGAGINFNTTPPSAVTGSPISTSEGCATVSDNVTGNLLFYSDSRTIWDANNQPMPNGSNLFGDPSLSSTSAVVIIPKPFTPNIYYVVTINQDTSNQGIHYSVVDMTLNGGLGDVVAGQKNIFLYAVLTEKMTVVPSGDNLGYWLITHDTPGNTFTSIKVTQTGFSTMPVLSSVGNIQTFEPNHFKINRQFTKMAITDVFTRTVELFDFDFCTGVFSNPIQWQYSSFAGFNPYGIEFSPDGTKLYISTTLNIRQFTITSNNPSVIQNTGFDVVGFVPGVTRQALQLGPDNKIYVASNPISVINSPNMSGASCGFQENAINLGGAEVVAGLPNWIYAIASSATNNIVFSGTCLNDNTQFSLQNNFGIQNVSWNFGDIPSGSSNTASGLNVPHLFSAAGNYNVTATITYACTTETINTQVFITNPQTISVAPISLCLGEIPPALPTTIPSTTVTGTWSPMMITTATAGTSNYTFTANPGQCVTSNSFTLTVTVNNRVTPTFSFNTSFCAGGDLPIVLPIISDNAIFGTWSPNMVSIETSGSYVFTPNSNECATPVTVDITVLPLPQVTVNQGCEGKNYKLSVNQPDVDYQYQWFDSLNNALGTSTAISVVSAGTYTLRVTDGNCFNFFEIAVLNTSCGSPSIPQGISPNDDGDNDSWDLSAFKVKNIEIYNRYGQKVYSKDNYTNQWNGNSNDGEELPSATYFYYIVFDNYDKQTGWIYLNREF